MQSAPLPPDEDKRLATLIKYEVLDSDDEAVFDELTELAGQICGTPISLISLVDTDRQWFKSRQGLDVTETPREIAFCSHAILEQDIFEVPDATKDERFFDNPLVTTEPPGIQFYAGAQLVTREGQPIGTLCVIDNKPRELNDNQRRALQILSNQVVRQLELRLHMRHVERMGRERDKLFASIAHDLRSPFTAILGLSSMLSERIGKLPEERVVRICRGILTSSTRFYQILDELLQWSQHRLGSIKYEADIHDLHEIAEGSKLLLKDAVEVKGLAVENRVPVGLEVFADAALTKTILRNLLANAIKYSADGSAIWIDAVERDGHVQVSVTDQGSGVAPGVQDLIFRNPVDSEPGTHREQGFGLGLSLCKEFVEMQGGQIWLDDQYTDGSRFVFRLPMKAEQVAA